MSGKRVSTLVLLKINFAEDQRAKKKKLNTEWEKEKIYKEIRFKIVRIRFQMSQFFSYFDLKNFNFSIFIKIKLHNREKHILRVIYQFLVEHTTENIQL